MESISRGQFLKTLGLSSKALMAFYCIGAVSSCKSDDNVEPDGSSSGNSGNNNSGNAASGITGATSGNSLDFTIDLKNANYSKLTTDGEFVIVGDALIANAGGQYVAVSKKCTHEGTNLQYRKAQGDFFCNNHGSEFSLTGAVEKDPASSSLKVFSTKFDAAASTLQVKA